MLQNFLRGAFANYVLTFALRTVKFKYELNNMLIKKHYERMQAI